MSERISQSGQPEHTPQHGYTPEEDDLTYMYASALTGGHGAEAASEHPSEPSYDPELHTGEASEAKHDEGEEVVDAELVDEDEAPQPQAGEAKKEEAKTVEERLEEVTEKLNKIAKEREEEKKQKEEEKKAQEEAKKAAKAADADTTPPTPESKEFAGGKDVKYRSTRGGGLTRTGREYKEEGSLVPLDKVGAPTLIFTKDGNTYFAPEASHGKIYNLAQTRIDRTHAALGLDRDETEIEIGKQWRVGGHMTTEVTEVLTLEGTTGDPRTIPTENERDDWFAQAEALLDKTKERVGFKYGSLVQYEAGSDGNSRLADEFTQRGDLMDWKSHPWASGWNEQKKQPQSRKILITTQLTDGTYKEWYVEGNNLYDMTASEEADEVKLHATVSPESPLRNTIIGEQWDELPPDSGIVTKVVISRHLARKESPDADKQGEDPFTKAQELLRNLRNGDRGVDDDGDEPRTPEGDSGADPSTPEDDPDNHLVLRGEKGKLVQNIVEYLKQHGKRVNDKNVNIVRQSIGLDQETVAADWKDLDKGDVYEFSVSSEAFDRLKNDKNWIKVAKEKLRGTGSEGRREAIAGATGAAATGEAVDDAESDIDPSELSLATGNVRKDIVAYLRANKRKTSDENIEALEKALRDKAIQGDRKIAKGSKAVVPSEVYEDLDAIDPSELSLATGNQTKDIQQYLRDHDLRVSQANIERLRAILRDNAVQRGRRVVQGGTAVIPQQAFNELDKVKK